MNRHTPKRVFRPKALPTVLALAVFAGLASLGQWQWHRAQEKEALALANADGIIAVKGFFYRDDAGTFLCSLLAESFPPQCGGATLELDGPATEAITVEIKEAPGVQWTDEVISLFGTVRDGTLTINAEVAG